MHLNDMKAREPETKQEQLENYLKMKEETEVGLLIKLNKTTISQAMYQLLLADSERGYREFLKSLHKNEFE